MCISGESAMKKKQPKRRFSKTKGKGLTQAELKKISGGAVEYTLRVFNDARNRRDPAVYQLDPRADRDSP